MKRVVIIEFMDERAVEELRQHFNVLHDPALLDDASRLKAEALNCDALIVRNRTQVRGELLQGLIQSGRCQLVGRLGVGLDNIDTEVCAAAGLRVIPATGANALSVAEYVITTAMMLLRGCYVSSGEVAGGHWPRAALSNGSEIAGKTLSILGFGMIGQLSARLAQAMGMHVMAHDALMPADHRSWAESGVRRVSADEAISQADVLSLHLPLLDSTRGLIDAKAISRMKRGAIVINSARAGIVDDVALVAALRSGHLGGAAIDVFEQEPLKADNPFRDPPPNLLLTPHVAGVTAQSNERVSFMIAREVTKALNLT